MLSTQLLSVTENEIKFQHFFIISEFILFILNLFNPISVGLIFDNFLGGGTSDAPPPL